RQACARLPMRLIGFCLLPNHFHLVLWPRGDGDLSRWMQWLLTAHVHGYRKRYRRSGHVWQGRFKAFPIQEDDHLRTALGCVERTATQLGLESSLHPPGRPRQPASSTDDEGGLWRRPEP